MKLNLNVKMNKRSRRALIWGGLIVLIIIGANYGTALLDFTGQMQSRGASKEQEILRMLGAIGQKDYYQQALGRAKGAEKAYRELLLPGEDQTAVAAELHRLVTQLAEQYTITVNRVEPTMKPEKFDKESVKQNPALADFQKIRVKAQFKCTPDKLVQFLTSIESQPRFVVLERLEIRAYTVRPDKEITPDVTLMTYMYQPEPADEGKKKAGRS